MALRVNTSQLEKLLNTGVNEMVASAYICDDSIALGEHAGLQIQLKTTREEDEFFDSHFGVVSVGDNWTPRSTPVEAEDGDLFWVVNEHGKVVPAHWNAYQRGGVFQNLLSNDEGMCGFTVTHYQPIIRPEAPTS